jgi:hypothetical protein
MAWWGSLTQQFQQIAHQAVHDLQRHQPPAAAGHDATAKTEAPLRSDKGAAKVTRHKSQPARKSAASRPRRNDT